MDYVAILLSLASVAFSFLAFKKAKSAIMMAKTVIRRKNEQEDSWRLKEVITALNLAKEAAKRNEKSASTHRSAGHPKQQDKQQDIDCLREAQDALRTKLPISWSVEQRYKTNAAARDIDIALTEIDNKYATRDGWKDALSTLQIVIPRLEQEERKIKDHTLLPVVN